MATIRANVPLQFGLVSVPVNVMSAVKDPKEEVSLNTVCDGPDKPHTVAQINAFYRCPLCKNEDKDKMKKGRNLGGGNFTLVTEEEVAKTIFGADDDLYRVMTINVHPAEQVTGLVPAGSLYYLAPTAASGSSYNLLVEALGEQEQYALLIKWAIKTKLALYRLRVIDGVLAIEKFAWPEDVHPHPVAPALPVENKLLTQARMLLDMTATDFDLATYRDETRAGLAEWIAAQTPVAGLATTDKPTPKESTGSLEAQLAAMIEAAKSPAAAAVKTKATKARAKTKVVQAAGETQAVEAPAKPARARKAVTPKG